MPYDVVDLILQDHREVERLFEELRTDPATRPGLVPVLVTLLTAHSRAEEAEVYPAAREAGGADDVAHSQEEHVECDQLLAELAAADPDSPDFDAALVRVVKAVSHHLEEEETTVLPHMRQRLTEERRAELGTAFLDSRAGHLGAGPEDITKAELEQQAANAQMTGAGAQDKAELRENLREQASS